MSNLAQKSHDAVVGGISDGECDRGCCHYSHRLLTCSCGFTYPLPDSYYPKGEPSFSAMDRHLQDVLLYQLGITHSYQEKR